MFAVPPRGVDPPSPPAPPGGGKTGGRIAFSTLACPGMALADAVALGRSSGYAGVELRLIDGELIDPAMPAAERARVKRIIDAAGLPVVAVDSSIRLTDDDPGPQLAQFLEIASDWESPLVRVFGGALPDDHRDRRARLETAAKVLEAAVPAADRLGVRIGVETHDAFSSSAVLAELLALVGSPAVGAVWDSHHPHRMGESPRDVWANIGPRVLLAQVKDARRAPARGDGQAAAEDGWQLVLLGEGEVAVRDMLGLLAAGGYPGWISVEWEKRWHPEIEPPEVALPQHLAVLDSWISEISERQETA
jgi:sugar phosphate isomerase/epimerase